MAFHSQQTVEKSLKAILVEYNLTIPHIHNLIRLFELCDSLLPINVDTKDLFALDTIYTRSRYPGEFGMIPSGKPSIEDAKRYFQIASKIYNEITKQLKIS